MMLALVMGLYGGLLRLGWLLPAPPLPLALYHGPLMVCGFFGGLLSLERAIAARVSWALAAPLLLSVGTLLVASAVPAGSYLMLVGAVLFTLVSAQIFWRYPQLETALLTLGPTMLVLGVMAWFRNDAILAVLNWIGFFVLIIAAERLELSRFRALSRRARLVHLILAIALAISVWLPGPWRSRIFGGDLLLLSLWLWRYDIARRSLRISGLPRFTAYSLLAGYVWLSLAAILMLCQPLVRGTAGYDAALHGIFLGFVFSMVFGHAPVIVPAVFKEPLPFNRRFYIHLALLHLSVIWRLAGDTRLLPGHAWSGWLSIAAILLFLLNNLWQITSAKRNPSV